MWLGEDLVDVVTELATKVTRKLDKVRQSSRNTSVPATSEERKSIMDSQYASRPELKEMEKMLAPSDNSCLADIFKPRCPNCDSVNDVEPKYRKSPPPALIALTYCTFAQLYDQPLHQTYYRSLVRRPNTRLSSQ